MWILGSIQQHFYRSLIVHFFTRYTYHRTADAHQQAVKMDKLTDTGGQ
jgi:putative NIF3 family GTP cyclohydrolase 1 type 2